MTGHDSFMTIRLPASTDNMDFPPAIFLMGPTASGKSRIAMEIARQLPVELVSVDSAQVYQYMDIGTAKPDKASRAAVPHHLIDLIEPHESYSAAQFRDDALVAMREITGRGNIPLLAGGTMLYFRALLEGLAELPPADSNIRMIIDSMAEDKGWTAMHHELARLDPVSATRIKPGDSQRIQRALEVYYLTDRPMSEILEKPKPVYLPYRTIHVALVPDDRQRLHHLIGQRFDEMLELGLIGEVRRVRDTFGLDADASSMRCVGYRQVLMYLEKKIDLPGMRELGVIATRQLAKRQLTWLRSMQGLTVFDCFAEDCLLQILTHLKQAGLDVSADPQVASTGRE